ncbi:hypothetical protein TSUD_243760 [Trifolium subterraneum]|uniref:U2A'/phosphoprotein 32 family A C-terminal domain-containing protein n=1 Tax=Trifolium subterraneum TaxID=3900 RepID=A0A2Z6NZB2_TRISU|nr:hypothetical protein TSUD_243760 [Trifolium subterraneum]
MAILKCFYVLNERRVNKKVGRVKSSKESFDTLLAKLQHSVSSKTRNSEPNTFDLTVTNGFRKNSRSNVRVMNLENPMKGEAREAYEGGDENENSLSIKRELSDFDEPVASKYDPTGKTHSIDEFEDQSDRYSQKSTDTNHSGHVSDPSIGKTDYFGSPKLKRSCSNVENRDVGRQITQYLSPSNSQSFEDFRDLSTNAIVNLKRCRSMTSHCSADRVILKRHSSSQVLPSGSKKLWWKLFVWSHRNIHRTSRKSKLVSSSDTLEPKQIKALRHVQSSVSITNHSRNKIIDVDDQSLRRSRFRKQWFSFSKESSFYARVDAWVKDLEIQEPVPEDDLLDDDAGSISFPPSPDAGRPMVRNISQMTHSYSNLSKDILKASGMVQPLNPASSIAQISGFGIKAIPVISHFNNLRSVNLSNNFIVCISPGCLPRSVQTLNLSRNKISTIDGLKELTRLRVLDLCLSSCTLIRELYLAGNKINDIEGLHRLFKLTVLDLSFNKITTTKVLGQLVANYNSLLVLNLLGNAIQRSVGDEQLNKRVSGLLPKLVYLNNQPIKAQRAVREILIDRVSKATHGDSKKRSSVRRSMSRVGQGGSSSSRGHRSSASVAPKSRNQTKR